MSRNLSQAEQTRDGQLHVHIRCDRARDNGNGTWTVMLPVKSMPPESVRMLEELFPHFFEEVEGILAKEVLFHSLLSERDAFGNAPAAVSSKPSKLPY